MEDPVRDIISVVHDLTATDSPDVQRAAVYKYFAPNAGFHHPLAYIEPGVLSRESILGVYQWYRVVSPSVSIHVSTVVYDEPHTALYLDVEQTFGLFFLPTEPASSRLLVRLFLKEGYDGYRIISQENFLHPDDVVGMVSPAAPVLRLALRAFGTAFNICAKVSQVLGYWRPQTTGLAGDAYEKYKEPLNGQAKGSNALSNESDGTRPQSRKRGNGKKTKVQESKVQESKGPATSSDNVQVNNSSNQGGGEKPTSQP